MKEQFSRTERILGQAALEKLAASRVAVFGLGGVGGYVCEALVRSGIGYFDLIDKDIVDETNLNRQIIALHSTVGRPKTEVMRERMLDINPDADILVHEIFFLPENSFAFPFEGCDYIVDAVDTVTAKIELVMKAREAGIPIICSMGTGNKLDPGRLKTADLYETSVCPLAKVMRHELKKRGVDRLKVVYSDETPLGPAAAMPELPSSTPGSTAFVPAAAGLMIAAEVVKDLLV